MKSTNGAPPILEEARQLMGRGPQGYTSAELRTFIEAAEHIARPESALSDVDEQILRAADRIAPLFAEPEPHPPTPFDDRIEEAVAEVVEKEEEWEKAKGEVPEKAREERWERLKGSDVDAIMAAAEAARAAPEALRLAEEAFKRARVAKNELERARGRWRAVARLEE